MILQYIYHEFSIAFICLGFSFAVNSSYYSTLPSVFTFSFFFYIIDSILPSSLQG